MIGVIIGSRKMGINPDNVATPIAASLGDLITLALLSGISWGLYIELGKIKEVAWTSFFMLHFRCPKEVTRNYLGFPNPFPPHTSSS